MLNDPIKETRSRWKQIEELFHAALPLAVTERAEYVASACAEDSTLYEDVSQLLNSDDKASGFLQGSIFPLGLNILADESMLSTEIISEHPAPSSVDPMVGVLVGERYKIIDKLGFGGMGNVYLALDKPEMVNRRVVIKILKEERLADKWVVIKFQQEAEALTKIDDHGVVGILDAGTLPDGKPFLVMEYVEGQALRSYLKERHETQQETELHEVAEILQQAGRTLTAAHRAGIVHRDLKPENIMLRRNTSGDLQVKVIDFGIAKVKNSVLAPSTHTVHLVGTWQYMAPEQLKSEKATPLSDVYALGVIAYELLTGRRPFNAKTPVQLSGLQSDGVKVMPRDLRGDDIPIAAQEVLLKALAPRPRDRYQSARAFGDELAMALLSDEEEPEPVDPDAHILEEVSKQESFPGSEAEESSNIRGDRQSRQPSRSPVSKQWLLAGFAIVLIGAFGFALWRTVKSPTSERPKGQSQIQPQPLTPERALTYWLHLERNNGQKSNDSIGPQILADATSAFWFNVQTTQDGALYLFSEGYHKDGSPSKVNALFPTKVSGNGDARIATNTNGSVNKNPQRFDGDSGLIDLWVIWAVQPIPLLDEIIKKSFETRGTIEDPSQQAALRNFIEQHKNAKTKVTRDERRFRLTLKGRSEILVDLLKLEYHP
jgi:serine/threonine protein kinase